MSNYSLQSKIFIKGTIQAVTGLYIGGSFSPLSIGAPDSIVIRNPIDNKPYIPGSSLKGKMRSLMEVRDGTIDKHSKQIEAGPSKNPKNMSARLYGIADKEKARPSRVIVRDGHLLQPEEFFKNTDLLYTESKTEVIIDRISSGATPRNIERVPAGAEFKLDLVVNIMDGEVVDSPKDDEKTFLNEVFKSLQLVQDDYLGGNGSRGYGQVSFKVEQLTKRSTAYYKGEAEEEKLDLTQVPEDLREHENLSLAANHENDQAL